MQALFFVRLFCVFFLTLTPVDSLHHYFISAPVWLATRYNATENAGNSRRITRLGGTPLDCKLPQSPWAPHLPHRDLLWCVYISLLTLSNE